MERILDLPACLKVRVASFLSAADAARFSQSSKTLYEDLSLARIPMHIPFKSWYDEPLSSTNNGGATTTPKQGPKIPFLPHRTHSVTLTGSWSCRLGELQGRNYGSNSQAQFFIVAYPLDNCGNPYGQYDESECDTPPCTIARTKGYETLRTSFLGMPTTTRAVRGTSTVCSTAMELSELDDHEEEDWEHPSWLNDGGRIVWASRPLCHRHNSQPSNSSSSWVKLSVTFVPCKEEEYYLCVQPGPGIPSQHQQWWRHSLHMSNLMAHITFHDNPHSNFLMRRQYKSIVRHILKVENRGAYYTKILEATARSIRIQLARFGRNALDPVLESFFQSTGIPRDTDSLLVLEEIARFLSDYAYVNERRKKFNNSCTERDSTKEGASSNRDSVPDWVPYAESSIANRSHRGDVSSNHANDDNLMGGSAASFGGGGGGYMKDDSHPRETATATYSHMNAARSTPTVPCVPEQGQRQLKRRGTTRRLQKTVQNLWHNFLGSSNNKNRTSKRSSSRRSSRRSWRADEVTEEFSISVVPQDDSAALSARLNEGMSESIHP